MKQHNERDLETALARLRGLAPAGFMVGFHVRNSRPIRRVVTYSREWIEYYTRKNFVAADPTVQWCISQTGWQRWSDIAKDFSDPFGVLADAAAHGLSHGISVSLGEAASRTIAGLARSDRAFTDAEAVEVHSLLRRCHDLVGKSITLGPRQLEALEGIAIGMTYDEICAHIGISRTALRYRLEKARDSFGVDTNAEAVRAAIDHGFIASNPLGGASYGLPNGVN